MKFLRYDIFSMLSRETSGGKMIPEIDGIRFLAIFSVVYFHLWGNFAAYAEKKLLAIPEWFHLPAQILNQGGLGVEVFFVLSGFILGLPFANQYLIGERTVSLPKYFKRRITRLEVPYILNLLFSFCAAFIFTSAFNASDMWSHLLASVFYLHNLIFSELSSINCVAWSLEVEVQFYILAPLLAMMIFSIRPANLRRCLLLGSIFAASIGSEFIFQHHITLRLTLINFIQYFLSGFLVADIYLLEWGQSPSTRYGSDLVTLTALVALFTYRIFAPACGMLLIPWLVILVIMGHSEELYLTKYSLTSGFTLSVACATQSIFIITLSLAF